MIRTEEFLEWYIKIKKNLMGSWLKMFSMGSYDFENETTKTPEKSETFRGNVNSNIFHGSSCVFFDGKDNTEIFYSRQDAIDSGYRPCGMCKP